MNLKHFAVLQKLNGTSNLLQYVIENKDVPVEELEKAFGFLLENETSNVVDEVVTNYKKYLQKHTQLGIVNLTETDFEVTGHIDNNLLETIVLLTGERQEDIVHDLVAAVMSEIRGSKNIKIDNLDISDDELETAVKTVLTNTENEIVRSVTETSELETETSEHEIEYTETPVIEDIDDAQEVPEFSDAQEVLEFSDAQEVPEFSDVETADSNDNGLGDFDVNALDLDLDGDNEQNSDEQDGDNEQELETDHEIGDVEKSITPISFDSIVDEDDADESNDVETENNEELVNHYREAVQRVYDFVVKELQARDLDKRLNLHL